MRNFILLFVTTALVACGGSSSGGSSNSNPNNNPDSEPNPTPTVSERISVSNSVQLHTPASRGIYNLQEHNRTPKLSSSSNNPCFQLQKNNKQTYSLVQNSSQWWSTVQLSFTITNTCPKAETGVVNVSINDYKINGTNVSAIGDIAQTGVGPYMDTSSSNLGNGKINVLIKPPFCEGEYCTWAQIPANSSKTYSITNSISQAITAVTVGSVIIDGNPPPPPPPPPVGQGEIDVALDGSNLTSICPQKDSCNILITYNGSGLVAPQSFTYNPYGNLKQIVAITDLNVGEYTFSVSQLPTNVSTSIAPSIVSVSAGGISKEGIIFIYDKPVEKGNVTVNLNKIADPVDYAALQSADNMILQLVDENVPSNTQSCNINMGGSCTFNNLPISDGYYVVVEGVGNALNGIFYDADNVPVTLIANQTVTKTIDYVKVVSSKLVNTTFNISGLTTGVNPTVQFTDTQANFKYVSNNLKSGTYKFVTGEILTANPSAVPGYTVSISPSVFAAGTNAVNIVYSKVQPSTATYDYIAPFMDYNNKVVLSFNGISSGKAISFTSNFSPTPGWGSCFGISADNLSLSSTQSGAKYITTLTPKNSGTSMDLTQSCDIMGTNSGGAIVLAGVVDPIVYSASVDGNDLSINKPCSATQCADPGNGYTSAGYYAQWSVWGHKYNPYNMPFSNINQIIYAFIGFNPADGSIKTLDASADSWGLSAVSRAMLQYPYMNASLSFGGWTNNGINTAPMFMQLSSSDTSMNTFASQSIALMRATGFSGIDIDWEWWSDYANEVAPAKQTLKFFTILRNALDVAGKQDNKHYNLTLAVNGGVDRILALQNTAVNPNAIANYWAQINTLVDRINVMNYDYHGSFEAAGAPAYFQANFAFPNASAYNVGQSTGWSIQDSTKAYIDNGVSPKKIVIGVPLYGRTMTVSSATNGGLFQGIIGAGFGDYQLGVVDYKCIVNPVVDPVNGCGSDSPIAGVDSLAFYNTTSNQDLFNQYGNAAMETWGYSPLTTSFLTYDSQWSAVSKTQFMKSKGLGGMMFWELDGDSITPSKSILQSVKNELSN